MSIITNLLPVNGLTPSETQRAIAWAYGMGPAWEVTPEQCEDGAVFLQVWLSNDAGDEVSCFAARNDGKVVMFDDPFLPFLSTHRCLEEALHAAGEYLVGRIPGGIRGGLGNDPFRR